MPTPREEIPGLVERLYERSAAGDWDTVRNLVTDDFVVIEASSLPMAGEYKGVEGLQALFRKTFAMVDLGELDQTDMLVGDDCAIAIVKMHFADESLEPAELCELFRFRDGKCCEIRPYYFDPSVFHAACEAKTAAG